MTHAFRFADPIGSVNDVPTSPQGDRGRVVIATSRLPLSLSRDDGTIIESAGGVASALRALHDRTRDVWLGAASRSELDDAATTGLAARLRAMRSSPVTLADDEMNDFYGRYANGILWPALHEVPCPFPGDRAGWLAYRRANERFADAVADEYRPGDKIWVHDYQLMLLPAMIRRRIPDATIGFFLHTPVPPAPSLKSIREWPDLLAGMLGANVIGVHTTRYVQNLLDAGRGWARQDQDAWLTLPDGNSARVEAVPIGVDSRRFDGRARSDNVQAAAVRLRAGVSGPIFLGVDRLDYTKGIAERLRAFERLLRFEPGLHGRAKFVQIAVPSREGVAGYAETRRVVESLVASINARYGRADWQPVEYRFESVRRDELVAWYCAADVMVVTPRRDGMNLVAKEFVASRFDEEGALVLSSTAGAASELSSAILVDPTEPASIMEGYRRALQMTAGERRARMRRLRRVVRTNDIAAWGRNCLAGLSDVSHADTHPAIERVMTVAIGSGRSDGNEPRA